MEITLNSLTTPTVKFPVLAPNETTQRQRQKMSELEILMRFA
ncbi:MAG: hypothetical protein ACM37W_01750 [Actinomycetota bacterium]